MLSKFEEKMVKVTELSDKELDDLISKHDKMLTMLLKEKGKRTGKPILHPKTELSSNGEKTRQNGILPFVIDDDVMVDNNIIDKTKKEVVSEENETANMRLTKVLKLSKHELERFNRAVEIKVKKKKE